MSDYGSYYWIAVANWIISHIFVLPSFCYQLWRVWSERNSEFVRIRGKYFTMILNLTILLQFIPIPILLWRISDDQTLHTQRAITVYQIFELCLWVTLSLLIGIRLYRICYKIQINRIVNDWAWRRLVKNFEDNFWTRNKNILSHSGMQLSVAFIVFGMVIPAFSYGLASLFMAESSDSARNKYLIFIWQTSYFLFSVVLLAIPFMSITAVKDKYSIRTELIRALGIPIVICATFKIASLIVYARVSTRGGVLLSLFGFQLCLIAMFFFSSFWMLRRQAQLQQYRELVLNTATTTGVTAFSALKKVLTHPEAFRAFADHLVSEYACENLLFIIEVLQYKAVLRALWKNNPTYIKTPSHVSATMNIFEDILSIKWIPKAELFEDPSKSHNVRHMLHYFYNKYFDMSAALTINISSMARDNFSEKLKQITRTEADFKLLLNTHDCDTIFDESYLEVWKVLQWDSFPKFRVTSAYNDQMTHLELVTISGGSA